MKYTDYLHSLPTGSCPFCASDDRRLIENRSAYVTYALAPYHRHHLLIIPKEHRKSFLHLSQTEYDDIQDLAQKSARLLRFLGYENFTLMVREGFEKGESVEHLHYHFIPNVHLGDLDHATAPRNVMTDIELTSLVTELRNAIDRL
jgi:diadenosine tetraphosphate (Ap4A) HIT family hydrolase